MDKRQTIEITAASDGCRIECTEKDGECRTGYADVFESDYLNGWKPDWLYSFAVEKRSRVVG